MFPSSYYTVNSMVDGTLAPEREDFLMIGEDCIEDQEYNDIKEAFIKHSQTRSETPFTPDQQADVFHIAANLKSSVAHLSPPEEESNIGDETIHSLPVESNQGLKSSPINIPGGTLQSHTWKSPLCDVLSDPGFDISLNVEQFGNLNEENFTSPISTQPVIGTLQTSLPNIPPGPSPHLSWRTDISSDTSSPSVSYNGGSFHKTPSMEERQENHIPQIDSSLLEVMLKDPEVAKELERALAVKASGEGTNGFHLPKSMEAEIMSTHHVPAGDVIPQSTSMEQASTITPMLAHISLESGLSPPLLNVAPTHSGMPEEMEDNLQNSEEQHEEEEQNVGFLQP